ncbi:MAG TPA: hypothetical protein PK228_08570, partial [Saprospiraceae bacterium]|nr:hypothetical protein [Saprospiraceae bacterium]
EFSLLFSNDWNIVPVSVPAGSLSAVQYIIVTDSFGFRTRVDSAVGNADDLWSLVSLNKTSQGIAGKTDPRLFLPPIAFKTQEGNPIEQVLFLRDEMANMVWGVEKTIPGIFGEGTDAYQAYLQRKAYLSKDIKNPAPVETENGTTYQYEFMTTVPENWIPFIPALTDPPDSDNPDIRLLRGKMLRDMPGVPEEVKPRGVLLTEQPFPFYVFEEEVPREGAQVTRSFQRTRWWNGKVVTWIGRRKRTGRGEGSSGLAFDQLIRNSG